MVTAPLRTRRASWSVAWRSWASTASWGPAAAPGDPRPPAGPIVMYLIVSSRSAWSAWIRLVIWPPSRENCSTRWYASALRAEETTLTPPRITAASVGSRTSSSSRDLTRQFFRARREVFGGAAAAGLNCGITALSAAPAASDPPGPPVVPGPPVGARPARGRPPRPRQRAHRRRSRRGSR